MKTLTNIIATVGFFLFIGSVGAGEAGTIGFVQALIQTFIGAIMFIGGAGVGIYMYQG